METSYLPNLIVNCVLTAITLYLLVAFSFYEYSTRYWNTGIARSQERHNKIARILRIICIVGISFAFIHHVCEIVSPFLVHTSACQGMSTMWLLTYALGILTVYIFLWQRQHCLYEGPALKHLLNGCIKAFSWVTLVFLVVSAITVFLAGSRMIFFAGCADTNPDSKKLKMYEIILAITLLVLTVVGQTQLLILFIIPLRSHTTNLKKSGAEPSEISEKEKSSDVETPQKKRANTAKERSNSNILSLIKRCIILASLSLVSDIVAATITILTEDATGKLAYDINILVNIMCCVCSFQTWQCMIFPWRRTRRNQKAKDRTVSVRRIHRDLTEDISL